MTYGTALEILFVMLAAAGGGALAKKLRVPLIVGYLLAGVVIGSAFKIRFGEGLLTPVLAELGVGLLLFSLGLEFPLRRLTKIGRPGILGALVQMLLTMAASLIIFTVFFDFSLLKALFFGSLISLSSTVVAAKILAEHGALETAHGELMITWLLVQDLAVIPLLIIFSAPDVLVALLKSLLFLGLAFVVGRRIVPSLFSRLAFLGSQELLTIASFTICVLFSFLTYSLGLSFAVGAFLAGILLTSADLSHEVHGIIRPLRDLFAAVFFVSLGFLVNPETIAASWSLIIILTATVLALKFAINYGVARFLGYHQKVAFTASLGLSSVGELAFILAAGALSSQLITGSFYQTILVVVILTLVISPVAFANATRLYKLWRRLFKDDEALPALIFPKPGARSGHIVLIGFGRVGRHIAETLEKSGQPFVVVDYNLHTLKDARRKGYSYVYGDPTLSSVLAAANLATAKAVVLAVPDIMAEELIIKEARQVNPSIKIYCRAHTKEDADFLQQFGVNAVIEPEIEAAKALSSRL